MDFAPDRKHELENHARKLRLHLYHYDEETIEDYYRFYYMSIVWTIISLVTQVMLLDLTFGGEFVYMGYRLAFYFYTTYYLKVPNQVNPMDAYFPIGAECAGQGVHFWGYKKIDIYNAHCILGLNPLYSWVNLFFFKLSP